MTKKQSTYHELRKKLPIYEFKSEICKLIREKEVVLVVGETGSGKSTQISQFLHETKLLPTNKKNSNTICITQPRRVAAITIAKRVSDEMGCRVGTLVGHRVRFDDCTDLDGLTKIMYVTDGMLLREATCDSLLKRYGVIVLDEAHERSLQTDILFGVVKRAMEARRKVPGKEDEGETLKEMREQSQKLKLCPLKVVVMSATLDIALFQTFFPDAGFIQIPGRQYPVQILYTRHPQEDYMDAALTTILQIQTHYEYGDILVFLPGQEDIEDLAFLLKSHLRNQVSKLTDSITEDVVQSLAGSGTNLNSYTYIQNGVLVCILYAALPPDVQMMAFQPAPKGCRRKIILSTNIAETSVTLEGIRFVVDTGKHKTRHFSGVTSMESLTVADVSKAQAAQRAGRAGRTSSGYCFRLYTEDAFQQLQPTETPEILRVNLAHVVLQLKGMGVHDPRSFDFVTPPDPQSLVKSFELLFALGAIDSEMNITDHGKQMAQFPLDPTFAHLLLCSPKYNCISEMLTAVAMLSAENIFYRPGGVGEEKNSIAHKAAAAHRRFASYEGDLPTLLTIYEAWRKEAVYNPRKRTPKKHGEKIPHGEWCTQNYISGRALTRAFDIRNQLSEICARPTAKNGLWWDIPTSGETDLESFLKCACEGLFLQAASRIADIQAEKKRKRAPSTFSGRYRTKIGGQTVSIHPTSTVFGRNPAPKCVVYTDLLATTKNYIRGVTQIREEWLAEVAPQFFKQLDAE